MAARVFPRALPATATFSSSFRSSPSHLRANLRFYISYSSLDSSLFNGRTRRRLFSSALSCREDWSSNRGLGKVFAEQRGYRKVRRRPAKNKEKELELDVKICIEEQLPDDPEIMVSLSLYMHIIVCIYELYDCFKRLFSSCLAPD